MPIQYKITQRKNNIQPTAKNQYIMQAVHTGEVNLEQIAYEISNECTLSKTDIVAVLYALGEKTKFHLEEGKVVNLDNLGRFKVGFKAAAQPESNLLQPKNIQRFYINYQPHLKLKKWLKAGLNVVKYK